MVRVTAVVQVYMQVHPRIVCQGAKEVLEERYPRLWIWALPLGVLTLYTRYGLPLRSMTTCARLSSIGVMASP